MTSLPVGDVKIKIIIIKTQKAGKAATSAILTALHLCDLPAFMVPPNQGNSVRIANLQRILLVEQVLAGRGSTSG